MIATEKLTKRFDDTVAVDSVDTVMKDGSVFRYGGREVLSDDNIFPVYGMHAYVETVHGLPVVVMHEDDWGADNEG